jgi:hypothetical protein
MKILVTGGAGFIGSALIRYIINNSNDSIVNVDKLTYAGNLESLKDVAENERYFFEKVIYPAKLSLSVYLIIISLIPLVLRPFVRQYFPADFFDLITLYLQDFCKLAQESK